MGIGLDRLSSLLQRKPLQSNFCQLDERIAFVKTGKCVFAGSVHCSCVSLLRRKRKCLALLVTMATANPEKKVPDSFPLVPLQVPTRSSHEKLKPSHEWFHIACVKSMFGGSRRVKKLPAPISNVTE
jgi:hypothetical protein